MTRTTLRATTLSLTGDLPGPESPLPAFAPLRALPPVVVAEGADEAMAARIASGRLPTPLPYARHSDYRRTDGPLELPALVLDNGVLEATVLPSLGGRVWSLRDRVRDRELLFVNPVLRFANFALTDGWFAGGIEWNLGSTGHWTLSSRPLHAARIETGDGDALRLWEWERTRDLVLQIDLQLDGDRLLASTRVINPDAEPTPLYYWTNIAVPETAGTRVLSAASTAWRTDYAGQLTRVAVPHPDSDDVDISYPAASTHAADYFFETDPPGRFVAAVEPDGRGFAQTATDELRGRKLFLWGNAAGGDRWQEWLSGPGARYAEIQAGWCTTQLEHDILPGGGEVSWTESFGAVDVDPADLAEPFGQAAATVATAVSSTSDPERLAQWHARWRAETADLAPAEILHVGSGWGAVELALRERTTATTVIPTAALPFGEVADTSAVGQALLAGDPESLHRAVQAQPLPPVSERWQPVLADERWDAEPWVRYARAVSAQLRGELPRAEAEYRAAVELAGSSTAPAAAPPVAALRGLAVLAADRGDHLDAGTLYARALAEAPGERTLLTEAVAHELAADRPVAALVLLDAAPRQIAEHGRNRLLRAHALRLTGDLDAAAAILDDLEVPDLAEGGRELDELWRALHPTLPLPRGLDFRMGAD